MGNDALDEQKGAMRGSRGGQASVKVGRSGNKRLGIQHAICLLSDILVCTKHCS